MKFKEVFKKEEIIFPGTYVCVPKEINEIYILELYYIKNKDGKWSLVCKNNEHDNLVENPNYSFFGPIGNRGSLPQEVMGIQSLKRPDNFNELSAKEQWEIDKSLGILDWDGTKCF